MLKILYALGSAATLLRTVGGVLTTDLTAQNFNKAVLESNDIWLIELAPEDTLHNILHDEMNGVTEKFVKSGIKVGHMNCDDKVYNAPKVHCLNLSIYRSVIEKLEDMHALWIQRILFLVWNI